MPALVSDSDADSDGDLLPAAARQRAHRAQLTTTGAGKARKANTGSRATKIQQANTFGYGQGYAHDS